MSDNNTMLALQDRHAVLYQHMCTAISECHKIDEIKQYRDKTKALEEYAKQAKNLKAERLAAEVRIRAERRAGELLAELAKMTPQEKGVNGMDVRFGIVCPTAGHTIEPPERQSEFQQALADTGITRQQASIYQGLAKIPEAEFEARLVSEDIKPSTRAMLPAPALPMKKVVLDAEGLPSPINNGPDDFVWDRLIWAVREFESYNFFKNRVPWKEAVLYSTQREVLREILPVVIKLLQQVEKEIQP